MNIRGRKVTVMGLGCHGGGVAATRFCAQSGATVTVTDLADEAALTESLATLSDVPVAKFTLGQHQAVDFCTADVVVVNPAVKPKNPHVELARQAGATITSETELFLNACPATVIGVTGTVGKSTTSAMLGAILKSAGRHCWLGGNIGNSLLADVPHMKSADMVVLEMSSFQLHWLSPATRWPAAAIITNCSPNHLDWHGTWNNYVAAKQRLLSHLPSDGFAVLNSQDREIAGWQPLCRGKVLFPPHPDLLPPLRVFGSHAHINAACAAAAAKQLGVNERSISRALAEFAGLPHRLHLAAEIGGRRFYNDSKSTTPAATLAALNAMQQPTWLLLGGADKCIDFAALASAVTRQAKGVAVFGSVAEQLQKIIHQANHNFPCFRAETLHEALNWSWRQSNPDEAILLSPGCASTDQFRDFAHRGEEFERLVDALGLETAIAAGRSLAKH
ncbi:MAG TPA: UDP-N-acetylmuramoyl-L-alanine--D-glutamate ligase [Pirellulales bacterium]|nr:UDP-N-acetylmuramoyl-L-alanine--D-glutamate ligase [Pirellulales bacterium]